MKLASPAELRRVTGMKEPEEQLRVLRELGVKRLRTVNGMVNVYEEDIADSMFIENYEPTALYRHWDRDLLLYVGISLNPIKRTGEHRRVRPNAITRSISNITIEWFPTRQEAIQAETEAIRTEKPLLNRMHNR